ncbi:MAG: diguanylate cyclase [Chloroflexi bacterium]|nr:diguanylate cyclase [Chloroflexota bacterium]MCL5274690.1 diguanylate cyclase [Chloroflexota bacterium]
MSIPLRILILEDNPSDAELMLHELRWAGYTVDWRRVETESDYLAALDPALDVILADYTLPQFDGLRALRLLQERGLDIPFIIVTGTVGEEAAVGCMKQGAADYMLKDRLTRLGLAVVHALEQKKLRGEKRQMEQALRDRERLSHALIEHSHDAIALISAEGVFLYASPSTTRIVGYAIEELVGETMFKWIHAADLQNAMNVFTQLVREPGASVNAEFQYRHKDGTWRWLEGVATNLLAVLSVDAIVANFRDITERKSAERDLQHMSTHDALTGLYNRAFFEEELARLKRGRRFPVSVVIADADDLKAVNDSQGHSAGDGFLRQAARILLATFRAEDTVARIGGDEFAVLLPGVDASVAATALERLTRSLLAYNAAAPETPLSLSLGTATAENSEALQEALKQADAHMYRAKSAQHTASEEDLRRR